jgi:hypothetical protein
MPAMTICRSSSCRAASNTRSDEYGGSLENRTRLIREMIEDTKDAVGGIAPWRSGLRSMSCTGPAA